MGAREERKKLKDFANMKETN